MGPVELHVYDFDGTLYDSPRLRRDRPDWWFSAKSLAGYGAPGRDGKWILDTVVEARRSIRAPWVRTALLTGRPKHREMVKVIKRMLSSARLPFNRIQLKPLVPPGNTPKYKAEKVYEWLQAEPSITKVVFYDDLQENLDAVEMAATLAGVKYQPVLASGVS